MNTVLLNIGAILGAFGVVVALTEGGIALLNWMDRHED